VAISSRGTNMWGKKRGGEEAPLARMRRPSYSPTSRRAGAKKKRKGGDPVNGHERPSKYNLVRFPYAHPVQPAKKKGTKGRGGGAATSRGKTALHDGTPPSTGVPMASTSSVISLFAHACPDVGQKGKGKKGHGGDDWLRVDVFFHAVC